MQYYILQSGSKGNCTVISSNGHHLMIDNGMSKKKLINKLAEINLTIDDIEVLLITHCHCDHISGISSLPKEKYYSTSYANVGAPEEHFFYPYETYSLASFEITCLPTSHDAPGSCGFIIDDGSEKLVLLTDTGFIYERVCELINDAQYYIMEANHNVRMLMATSRPQSLKKRIMGDSGHLSNEDCANYLCDVIGPHTKEIILAHLSAEANSESQALADVKEVFENRGMDFSSYSIRCASQVETIFGGLLEVK
jgi:phosphoribosyl 1,2-cyclic phosphodiesterase